MLIEADLRQHLWWKKSNTFRLPDQYKLTIRNITTTYISALKLLYISVLVNMNI